MSHFVIKLGSEDVSQYCIRPHTVVNREISGRISTATLKFRADVRDDGFRLDLSQLDIVPLDLDRPEPGGHQVILIEDGAANVLFRGRIKSLKRTPYSPDYWEFDVAAQGIEADLERIQVDTTYTGTDRAIIQAAFASNPLGITTDNSTVASTLASVDFDAHGMGLKRLLDELVSLTGCDWYIDHGTLALHWYLPVTASLPAAPFDISDTPDDVATFAARIDWAEEDWFSYANSVTVKGAVSTGGTRLSKTEALPGLTPEETYGLTITDDALTTQALVDARAAYELETRSTLAQEGSFEIEKDGLAPGQVIHVTIAARSIDADYQIRSVSIREEFAMSKLTYSVSFGLFVASYYDAQRVTKRITTPTARVEQINTGQIFGQIEASGNVTVNTNALYGVILADEVADGVIDALEKFDLALRPIPILGSDPSLPSDSYPEGAVYLRSGDSQYRKVVSGAWSNVTESAALAGKTEFVNVGELNVSQLNGLILASQIDTVNVDQLNGLIQSDQIYELDIGKVYGNVTSGGPITINGGAITLNTVPGSAIVGLAVSKLTADNAVFGASASFGYASSQNRLTITSTAVSIEGDSNNYVRAMSGGVTIYNSGRQIVLTASGIELTSGSSVATLAAGSLKLVNGSANAELTASGLQFWGGSSGIGFGASTFASSPMRIASSGVIIEKGDAWVEITSTGTIISYDGAGISVDASGIGINADVKLTGGSIELFGIFGGGDVKIPSGNGYYVGGNKVLGALGSAIANPAATLSDLQTAVIAILDRMRAKTPSIAT